MSDVTTPAPCPSTDEDYSLGVLLASGYRGVFGHFGSFLVAAALPWLLVLVVEILLTRDLAATLQGAIASGQVNSYGFLRSFQGNVQTVFWLEFIAGFVTSILFAVAWHRFMLGHGRPRLLPAIGGRHLAFFGYSLLLALPLVIGGFLGGLVSSGLSTRSVFVALLPVIVGVLVGLYCSLRMSLCLPAAAVGESAVGPGYSWEAMRGKVLVLFFASLFAALPLALVMWLLQSLQQDWMTEYFLKNTGFPRVVIMQGITGIVALALAGLGIGVLSQALRSLIPNP